MNKKLRISHAVLLVIWLLVILGILSVWPARLWTENLSFSSGGGPQSIVGPVDAAHDAGEYFTAQYEHLQTLEVWVESVEAGNSLKFQLFLQGDNNVMSLTAEELTEFPDTIPGFVSIPVDADLIPGRTYVYTLRSPQGGEEIFKDGRWQAQPDSSFRVGFEGMEYALGMPDSVPYQVGFYNDTSLSGLAALTRLTYRVPLGKAKSAGILAALAGIGLVLSGLVLVLEKTGKSQRLSYGTVSVRRLLQAVLTPAVLFAAVTGFVMNWPLKLFDSRPLDLCMYLCGCVLFALWGLFGLWHRQEEEETKEIPLPQAAVRGLLIISIFMVLYHSIRYINALSDFEHIRSQGWIILWLCVLVFVMGERKWNLHPLTILALAGGVVLGVLYYRGALPDPSDRDYDALQIVLKPGAAAIPAAAGAAVSTLVMLFDRLRRGGRKAGIERGGVKGAGYHLPLTGAERKDAALRCLAALFLVLIVVFRNGRTWVLILGGMYLMLYLRFHYYRGRDTFLKDLCSALALSFAWSAVYSLLFRYYVAYVWNRFSMQFHTVTVTAYYLAIAAGAALALYFSARRKAEERPFRERARLMWKEALFLGAVMTYMIMSITRAGIAVLFVIAVLALILYTMPRFRETVKGAAGLLLILVLCFPVFFTGQRMIPLIVGRPMRYELIEPYWDRIMRNVDWNDTRFMNVEIFIKDFGDRIIGHGAGSAVYDYFDWHVAQEKKVAEGVSPLISGESRTAGPAGAPGKLLLSAELELQEPQDTDISNGRFALFGLYMKEMNLTGHDHMGVELESGELAVHAHNVYIQTAFDFGLPAGFLFILLLLMLLQRAAACFRAKAGTDPGAVLPLLIITGYMITGMAEWIFQFSNPYTIVLLLSVMPLVAGRDEVYALDRTEDDYQ